MSASKRHGTPILREIALPFPKITRPAKPPASNPRSTIAFEIRIRHATAQDLLNAWECDLWHLSQSPISPDLKPLTAEELEGLVTRFPDVMPHIYVRPDAVIFGTAASQGNLAEVPRDDLVSSGEVRICGHVGNPVEVLEWCGDVSGKADVLAFNTLRVTAIHQTLILSRRCASFEPHSGSSD